MESEKYESSSVASCQKNDQIKGDKTSKKPYYGCTFCNRGFTNAQALGGHMNRHSKYRAKAKQIYNNSIKFNENCLYPTYSPSFIRKYHPMNTIQSRRNYNICFQLPPPAETAESTVSRDPYGCFNKKKEHNNLQLLLGETLSLKVGSIDVDGLVKDDELDLELRLGNGR